MRRCHLPHYRGNRRLTTSTRPCSRRSVPSSSSGPIGASAGSGA